MAVMLRLERWALVQVPLWIALIPKRVDVKRLCYFLAESVARGRVANLTLNLVVASACGCETSRTSTFIFAASTCG
jgi:hypothetical protein